MLAGAHPCEGTAGEFESVLQTESSDAVCDSSKVQDPLHFPRADAADGTLADISASTISAARPRSDDRLPPSIRSAVAQSGPAIRQDSASLAAC